MATLTGKEMLQAILEACEASRKEREEENKKAREAFKSEEHKSIFTRGTVIAAAAKKNWHSTDIEAVIKNVTTSERAEAAVGLIEADYDWYGVNRIIKEL